jgi:hypothetical protein
MRGFDAWSGPRSLDRHPPPSKLAYLLAGTPVRLNHCDQRPPRLLRWQRHAIGYFLVCACIASSTAILARATGGQLDMRVIHDRLTLAVTRYPQVYLYGTIDAEAPKRFQALVTSGRIPSGSDIYLNARSGDTEAGIALGRMFRAGGMATHLGTPRQPKSAPASAKVATCVDACAYAYFGGVYRWTPSGRDRIGFSAHPEHIDGKAPGTAASTAYLKQMGIDLGTFSPTRADPADNVIWLPADQMIATGMANNGRLPVTATYDLSGHAPTLTLHQVDRKGEHRLTIQCQPGKTTVTAYDEVGRERAREVVARGTHSYFQLDDTKVLDQPHDGTGVDNNALMIRRDYPPADLVDLISAWSFGAWVGGRSDAFRDGFTMPLHPVQKQLKVYYYACWRAAPWPARQKGG